jgi:putative CocE/NonD family hydrolase
MITHPAPDAFRSRHDFRRTITIPGFHATSWYDIFQTSVIAAFQDIQSRVGNQRLWIGPNDHYFIYESQFWERDPYFEWFDYWLKGKATPLIDEAPVYYSPRSWTDDPAGYVADDWHHTESWPPAGTETRRLHLRGDGTLSANGPGGEAQGYDYDPHRPVPTYGGRNMLIAPGPLDQSPARARPGYGLVYRGKPLVSEMTLAGNVRVTLHVQSDCPDTDFVVKLIEVGADERPRLLMDGVTRALFRDGPDPRPLAPDDVVALTVDLAHIHHTVPAGHRLEVDVTSSNFPRRARNTNSGNPVLAHDGEADIRVAHNTVHHASAAPSFIEIEVLPACERAERGNAGSPAA